MNIYLCDFRDSFTLNILTTLSDASSDFKINLVEFNDIKKKLESLINTQEKTIIILGPGPGHPNDYEFLKYTIEKILRCPHLFLMGICLGHQLIASALGLKIGPCDIPVHGQAFSYKLSDKVSRDLQLPSSITVQRYNSLCVLNEAQNQVLLEKNDIEFSKTNEDIFLFYKENLISYQFHPESIGTNFPKVFFKKAKSFLL